MFHVLPEGWLQKHTNFGGGERGRKKETHWNNLSLYYWKQNSLHKLKLNRILEVRKSTDDIKQVVRMVTGRTWQKKEKKKKADNPQGKRYNKITICIHLKKKRKILTMCSHSLLKGGNKLEILNRIYQLLEGYAFFFSTLPRAASWSLALPVQHFLPCQIKLWTAVLTPWAWQKLCLVLSATE